MNQQTARGARPSWLANVVFLAVCCIVGAIIGMLVFKPLLGKSEAIGILTVGSSGTGDSAMPIEQIGLLATRVIATDFTTAVAKRVGDPGAAQQLLAPVYGGGGDLSARALRDSSRIEIRVSNPSEKVATERLSAAMDEIMAQHEVIATNVIDSTVKQRDHYRDMLASEEKLDQQIAGEIAESTSHDANFVNLLAARSKILEQIAVMTQTLTRLTQQTSDPIFRRTQVLAGPSPLRPLINSSWQTGLLGAIAGFALGFIAIQVRRAIV